MASENNQSRVAWEVAFGNGPRKGSRAMQQILDFALQNPILLNLAFEIQSERIEFVQCLYVDNSSNPAPLTITFGGSGQVVIIPSGAQSYIPVLASMDNMQASVTTVVPNADNAPRVTLFYLNFPLPALVWATGANAAAGGTITDYSANAPAHLANLIATVPINAGRNHIEVQNQAAVAIQAVIDDGAGGNEAIILLDAGSGANAQGGAWESNSFKGRLRIFATNTTDQVCVYEN